MSSSAIFPQDHSAAEWREMAREDRQRAADSWERSDTDGFLSQWASGIMADAYDLAAELVEELAGDTTETALFDLDGNLLEARQVETRYGMSWLVLSPAGDRWFNQSWARKDATRVANDAKKGIYVGTVRGQAVLVPGKTGRYRSEIQRDAERTVADNGK
jgi:hypothetical protein